MRKHVGTITIPINGGKKRNELQVSTYDLNGTCGVEICRMVPDAADPAEMKVAGFVFCPPRYVPELLCHVAKAAVLARASGAAS